MEVLIEYYDTIGGDRFYNELYVDVNEFIFYLEMEEIEPSEEVFSTDSEEFRRFLESYYLDQCDCYLHRIHHRDISPVLIA